MRLIPTLSQARYAAPSDWQELQRIVTDLFREEWNDPYTTIFGSEGQRQNGVDTYGTPDNGQSYIGVQCKCVEKLTKKQIQKDYTDSQVFSPKLSRFIIATTIKRDAEFQKFVAELSQSGPYPCNILFWQDLCNLLSEHRSVLIKHYAEFFIFDVFGDSTGKFISVDIELNHYEFFIIKTADEIPNYGGKFLLVDLLGRKCQILSANFHWSRLEGFIGVGAFDAFLVAEFLKSFDSIESLLLCKQEKFQFFLSKIETEKSHETQF